MQTVWDQLLSLARDNDAETVRRLIATGCPPNYGNRMGQTAMHIAAIWGSVDAMQALLEATGNPNAQNRLRGQTPLHAAAMGRGPAPRRAECARLLIRFRGDPNMADMGGELPMDTAEDEVVRLALGAAPLILHEAVRAQSAVQLKEALGKVLSGAGGVSLDAHAPGGGEAALHLAAALGWRDGLLQLLAARASPTERDNRMQTPLHAAAVAGQWQCVADLVAARADPLAQDFDPEHDGRFTSMSFQENPDKHRTALHYSASLCNVLVVRALLEARSDPNIRDSGLETPLHLCQAFREPDAEVEAGAGVRVADHMSLDGRMGSAIKPCENNDSAWSVLLEGEAEPRELEARYLRLQADETLDALLACRADVNLGCRSIGETRTLLHEAARRGDVTLAERCVAAAADVNKQDAKLGLSALHMAARSKHHEMVALLLRARADPQLVSAGGRTACELAETNGATEATLALLSGGDVPADAEQRGSPQPQTLASLTAEQRAMLFMD